MTEIFAGYTLLEPAPTRPGWQSWWAQDTEADDCPVRLTRGPALSPEQRQRWRDGRALNHPNLVRTLAAGQQEGDSWIAEEVVDGLSLEQLLNEWAARGATLPADVVIGLAAQLSLALGAVHTAERGAERAVGLVHGGLNSEQVLVTRDGEVKLDGLMQTAPPPEMSPSDDLFSLGALMAQMLLGQACEDPQALPARLADRPDLPEGLPALILGLCHPDPGARPSAGEALTAQLDDLRAQLGTGPRLQAFLTQELGALDPDPDRLQAHLLSTYRQRGLPYPPAEVANPVLKLPRPAGPPPAPVVPMPPALQGALLEVNETAGRAASGPPVKPWRPEAEGGPPVWMMVTLLGIALLGTVVLARVLSPFEPTPAPSPPARPAARLTPRLTSLLEVSSEPAGAEVFVDGIKRGLTPLALNDLTAGAAVRVFVRRPGYRDTAPRTVNIDARPLAPQTSHFRLEVMRPVHIDSRPTGAKVQVDPGSSVRTTPFDLDDLGPNEQVTLRFEKRGFVPTTHTLKGGAEAAATTTVKLQPALLFNITSQPSEARVTIDGQPVGRTPVLELPLAAGRRFELEVSRPDTEPYKKVHHATGPHLQRVKVRLRSRPLSRLALTEQEKKDLALLSAERKTMQANLRRSTRILRDAKKALGRFETMATLRVVDVEAAQTAVDTAQTAFEHDKLELEAKESELEALRALVVQRLDQEP